MTSIALIVFEGLRVTHVTSIVSRDWLKIWKSCCRCRCRIYSRPSSLHELLSELTISKSVYGDNNDNDHLNNMTKMTTFFILRMSIGTRRVWPWHWLILYWILYHSPTDDNKNQIIIYFETIFNWFGKKIKKIFELFSHPVITRIT